MKLHLGCGDIRIDGWYGVDARRTKGADVVCRLEDVGQRFKAGSISAIYACHVLEHFGFNGVTPDMQTALDDWAALLKPGGELFISVPDLRQAARGILSADTLGAQFNFMKLLYGGCEYPENRHFIGFTAELLAHAMHNAGLRDVKTFEPFADDTSRFVLHGLPVSLNLRGVK